MNAEASQSPLLFNWQPPSPRTRPLVFFLGASLLLHAFCFYLFQIVYSPAVLLLPPPARVSLITPDSEEGRNLLRWVDAEDPALASATQRSPDARQRLLPKVQQIPSYVLQGPRLKQVPPIVIDTRAPSMSPPGPVPGPRPLAPSPFGRISTRLFFSDEFAALGAPESPPAHFTASNNETPQAIRFRISVAPSGVVRYCFPLNSSGDTSLDEQARQSLALTRFRPGDAAQPPPDPADVWGTATLDWGNDLMRPTAASPSPSP